MTNPGSFCSSATRNRLPLPEAAPARSIQRVPERATAPQPCCTTAQRCARWALFAREWLNRIRRTPIQRRARLSAMRHGSGVVRLEQSENSLRVPTEGKLATSRTSSRLCRAVSTYSVVRDELRPTLTASKLRRVSVKRKSKIREPEIHSPTNCTDNNSTVFAATNVALRKIE